MRERGGSLALVEGVLSLSLVACGSTQQASHALTHPTTAAAALSPTSAAYRLLTQIASDAYSIVASIDAVTVPDQCASLTSYECQKEIPEAIQQELAQLEQDLTDLASSGVLAGYSSDSIIATEFRSIQLDMSQLVGLLGEEIQGLETDNPQEMRMGAQAQAGLAGIDNSALAIREALTTSP
jgi:hypothetical protein